MTYITDKTMTVSEMIAELQKIPDKTMPVAIETKDNRIVYAITSIQERKNHVEVSTCFESYIRAKETV